MKKALIVVDMQNDFITGALGTPEAAAILPAVKAKIAAADGPVYFTRDTHSEDYLLTQEGKKLPVKHCILGTPGWELADGLRRKGDVVLNKPTFGSVLLPAMLREDGPFDEIELVGLCTDICVISNAMLLKAYFPEAVVAVDSACCAGVTPQSHQNALDAMRMCQIEIR